MKSVICAPWFVFLTGLLSSLVITIGGEISGTLFLAALTLPLWLKELPRKDKTVRWFFRMFVLLILVQICTEFFHGQNELIDKIKGVAVTVNGMVMFFFFYAIYGKNVDVIKWYILGSMFSPYLFPHGLQQEIMESGDDGNAALLKFVIAPLIINIISLVILFGNGRYRDRFFALCMITIGCTLVLMGARSSGLCLFAAGAMYIFISKRGMTLRKVKKSLLAILILSYAVYALVYVPMVMSGELDTGNNAQLTKSSNPYNPIEILRYGRADSLVPFYAFLDEPIIGWGYWADDPGLKYHTMQVNMTDVDSSKLMWENMSTRIPGHSVIFYYACAYGFLALILIWLIYYKVFKETINTSMFKDRYLLYRYMLLISVSWNIFFSPMTHFKTMPILMSFLIVSSQLSVKQNSK